MAISHAKSNTIGDMTGTVTVLNSQGSTVTRAATDFLRPSDWNSVHNQFLTLSGNTANSSAFSGSNIIWQGGNNITLSGTTAAGVATVVISGPNAPAVLSQSGGISNLGNTSGTSGIASGAQVRMLLAGGNNVTLSQSVNGASATITISAAAFPAVLSQSGGISNLGNTSGTSGIASGAQMRVLFAGGNNITLSQSVNGASATITISGPNTVAGGAFSAGNSTNGLGTTGVVGSQIVFFPGANITLSQSINGASASLSIVGPSPGGATGALTVGNTNLGNTAGGSGMVSAQMVLVGGNNVTLSGSINGQSLTLTINAGGGGGAVREGYIPFADHVWVAGQQGQGTLVFDPDYFPAFTCDRLALVNNYTATSNSSGSLSVSMWVGIYTRNGATLSLLTSQSTVFAVTNSGTVGSYSLVSGMRLYTMPFSTSFSEGRYWVGILSRTTTGGAAGMSMSQYLISQVNTNFVGHWQASNNTTMQMMIGQGVYTATTNALPAAVSFSQIRGSDSLGARFPVIKFFSGTV